MSLADTPISLVVNCGFNVSNCGYCKSGDTSHTFGIWAHLLTCRDYQDLIDRGWRRSGHYVYKPNLRKSCCPQYTIRLDATQFKPSKSQRKIISKFNRYIEGSYLPTKKDGGAMDDVEDVSEPPSTHTHAKIDNKQARKPGPGGDGTQDLVEMIHAAEDEHRPKDKRLKYRFQIVLEPASFTEEKYKLYCKYQIEIHNDPPTKLKEKGFRNFLVDSPLRPESPATADNVGYGSFHQNYLLDGRLVAVAVLDVLPKCVSSVYFMYDPDYAFLGLGKYSALREIALTKELGSKGCEDLKWYYMGFYIHTCQKMKYKGQYKPSGLLDPETYAWHSIDRCIPLLDRSKYVAFSRVLAAQGDAAAAHRARALLLQGGSMDENEDEAPPPGMLDPEEVTRDKLKEVFVLYKGLISPVVSIPPYHDSDVRAETRGYYAALGPELARRMLLYINDPDSDE
ncbi:hypothetical protein BC936DRAFT_143203 [Jimgerdemannia flammicorona]|uniref:Arginyl-tRNA--protein transferase 1 n=1 Tax=Jimgerdemannia flammicorona TaxID=994334 RepID=A0A433DMI6_9FUNG|nr:hypothetical protein BC936DRAFT_143203 [Jimgerdemannia flammicorona]